MSAGEFARLVLERLDWAILFYFLFVNGFYLLLLVSAALEMRGHLRRVWGESRHRILGSEFSPSISVLAPAYNEAATVVQSVRALLTLEYQNLQVVLVNDGSSDATMTVLKENFDLYEVHHIYRKRIETEPVLGLWRSRSNPALLVVDKANGRKADALNAGLQVAAGDLVLAIDTDTLIEPDALLRMVRPFLQGEKVLAVGGTIRIANASEVRAGRIRRSHVPTNPLAGFQVGEYLRAFLFGRLGWNRLGDNLIISGAFGLFDRESVIDAGGFLHETVGEDMELIARMRTLAYEKGGPRKVAFIPDPVAWTEAPESARVLARQRDRWHRGLSDVMWRYKRVLFNPRYRALGLVVYPYFFFVELLAPVIEMVGLVGLVIGLVIGAVDWQFAVLFFLVAYGLGLVLTVATLLLEEFSFHRYDSLRDRLLMLGWAVLESIGYRQVTAVWRLNGIFNYMRGSGAWGHMERRGFGDETELPKKTA